MSDSYAQLKVSGYSHPSDHATLELREYLDAVPHHVWTTDSTGTQITWYNRRWQEYSGLSLEEALADSGSSIVHADDAPALAAALTLGLEQQRPFDADVRLRSKDGEYCWFQIRGRSEEHT